MNDTYFQLIESGRVRKQTKEVLLGRIDFGESLYVPKVLSAGRFALLQVVIDRLIPQRAGNAHIDIARVLDYQLYSGVGDGWRFADLPPDHVALDMGLALLDGTAHRLNGSSFSALDPIRQDGILRRVQGGQVEWEGTDPKHWFEDLLASVTEAYVSHPATLADLGFSGIAFLPKWEVIGLGNTLMWEPRPR